MCRHGDVLSSPALSYTLKDLTSAVEAVRQEKVPKEQPEEDLEIRDVVAPGAAVSDGKLSLTAVIRIIFCMHSCWF